MIGAAFVLGFFILCAASLSLFYHVRPRRAFAQITVNGVTDQDGESFILTGTLFEDESQGVWQQKINAMCEIRQARLKYLNELMAKLQADAKAAWEADQVAKGKVQSIKG